MKFNCKSHEGQSVFLSNNLLTDNPTDLFDGN